MDNRHHIRRIIVALFCLMVILSMTSCGTDESNSQDGEEFSQYVGNGNYVYIDRNGELIIETDYRYVYEFSEGLACVMYGDAWGYMDRNGEIVIEPRFSLPIRFPRAWRVYGNMIGIMGAI